MYYLNPQVRHIHFVGIGGAGMSGLAEVLYHQNYTISGSDQVINGPVQGLVQKGIPITEGHVSQHTAQADLLIRSTAISDDNPELILAQQKGIKIVSRGQLLAELMHRKYGIAVAGTHGKTTTTGLIASLCLQQSLDPTILIGGYLNCIASHARLGRGRYLIAEADESDASLLYLKPAIAIVTNIDRDHMEAYEGDFQQLIQTFTQFLQVPPPIDRDHLQNPALGFEASLLWAIVCQDDPILAQLIPQIDRPVMSYGFSPSAAVRAVACRPMGMRTAFTVLRTAAISRPPLDIQLNLPGQHNVLNALAAITVGTLLNIPDHLIQTALSAYTGVGRRFQLIGTINVAGDQIPVIDDYGHHPREITATLQAIRQAWPTRRLVMVFQPHRYTRTQDLLADFAQALAAVDYLCLLTVYAASELPLMGVDSQRLAQAVHQSGTLKPAVIETETCLRQHLQETLQANDILLFQGAGDISEMAHAFVNATKRYGKS